MYCREIKQLKKTLERERTLIVGKQQTLLLFHNSGQWCALGHTDLVGNFDQMRGALTNKFILMVVEVTTQLQLQT